MAVHRNHWDGDFTIIPNAIFRDERLSLRDIGLLCSSIAKPEDWEFSVTGMAKSSTHEGRDAISASVQNLRAAGYVRGTQGNAGKFERGSFDVFDSPLTENPSTENPLTENPSTENPSTENPSTENPSTENPGQIKTIVTKNIQYKDIETKREGKPSARSRFVPPSVEEVRAYCAERGNGIDPEAFCDYYEAQGWKLSNGRQMRDWKAAVRTWERRNRERQPEKKASGWSYTDMSNFVG